MMSCDGENPLKLLLAHQTLSDSSGLNWQRSGWSWCHTIAQTDPGSQGRHVTLSYGELQSSPRALWLPAALSSLVTGSGTAWQSVTAQVRLLWAAPTPGGQLCSGKGQDAAATDPQGAQAEAVGVPKEDEFPLRHSECEPASIRKLIFCLKGPSEINTDSRPFLLGHCSGRLAFQQAVSHSIVGNTFIYGLLCAG